MGALLLLLLVAAVQARRGMSGTLNYGTTGSFLTAGTSARAGNDESEIDLSALDLAELAEDTVEDAVEDVGSTQALSQVGHDISVLDDSNAANVLWSRLELSMADQLKEFKNSEVVAAITTNTTKNSTEFKTFHRECKATLLYQDVRVYEHLHHVMHFCSLNASSPTVMEVQKMARNATFKDGKNREVKHLMQRVGLRSIVKQGWTPDANLYGVHTCSRIGDNMLEGFTFEKALKRITDGEGLVVAMKTMCCNKHGCLTRKRCSAKNPIAAPCVAM